MTEQQLARHQKWLRLKYGDIDGEDIFQQACVFAIQEYGIEKTNQNLFGLLCRWAARELFKHRSHEVPFSCLRQENNDQTDEVVFDPEDPEWQKEYDAIENREEIEKLQGQWLLNAMMKTAEPPKNMVTTKSIYIEEQIQLEFE